MNDDLEQRILGHSAGKLRVDSIGSNHEVTVAMVRQCRRLLDIASRNLDPAVYDQADVIEAIKALALRSRNTEIRVLVLDPGPVVAQGHRLIQLAHALSSYIRIRVPGDAHRDFNEAMLIADRTGYIHRSMSDRYEGGADFHDPATATDLLRRFDELWEHGQPDPNFRRLHL